MEHSNRPRKEENGDVLNCLLLDRMRNVTITSTGVGTLDGNGERWWGIPGIGFLVRKEDRPNLFKTEDSTDLLVENLFLKDAPHWTFETKNVDGLEIRYVEIEARRTDQGSLHKVQVNGWEGGRLKGRQCKGSERQVL